MYNDILRPELVAKHHLVLFHLSYCKELVVGYKTVISHLAVQEPEGRKAILVGDAKHPQRVAFHHGPLTQQGFPCGYLQALGPFYAHSQSNGGLSKGHAIFKKGRSNNMPTTCVHLHQCLRVHLPALTQLQTAHSQTPSSNHHNPSPCSITLLLLVCPAPIRPLPQE